MPIKTRKQFRTAVKKMAKLESLRQADAAPRAVISLTKTIIGKELFHRIAEVFPPDLREGWESIRALPEEVFERDELLYELGEYPEQDGRRSRHGAVRSVSSLRRITSFSLLMGK